MTTALIQNYYEAFTFSPYASEVLLDLAKHAIDEEQLGQRDVADLLCLSFSSNDLVGHCWGPDSQEVLDITLRSDLLIKDLLSYLDAKVGRTPDLRSDNLAAALVVTARSHGMSRIDHVVLSTDTSKVFAVQGALESALKRVASVPTVELGEGSP